MTCFLCSRRIRTPNPDFAFHQANQTNYDNYFLMPMLVKFHRQGEQPPSIVEACNHCLRNVLLEAVKKL